MRELKVGEYERYIISEEPAPYVVGEKVTHWIWAKVLGVSLDGRKVKIRPLMGDRVSGQPMRARWVKPARLF